MKKVIIASKNPVKINATKKAFEEVFTDRFEFEGVSADSLVSDQPMSNKETLKGATNRIENIQNLKADFFVSMEGGVDLLDDNYEAFAWIVISHKNKISKEGIDQNNTYAEAVKEQKDYKNISLEQRKEKLKDKDFQDLQKDKMKVLENLADVIQQEIRNEDGSINAERAAFWAAWLGTSSNLNRHPIRALAPITFFSDSKLPPGKGENSTYVAEHTMPANIVTLSLIHI